MTKEHENPNKGNRPSWPYAKGVCLPLLFVLFGSVSIFAASDTPIAEIFYKPTMIEHNMSQKEREKLFEKINKKFDFDQNSYYPERQLSVQKYIDFRELENNFPNLTKHCLPEKAVENKNFDLNKSCMAQLTLSLVSLSLAHVLQTQFEGFHWQPKVSDDRLDFALYEFYTKRISKQTGRTPYLVTLPESFGLLDQTLGNGGQFRVNWEYAFSNSRLNHLADSFGPTSFGMGDPSGSLVSWQQAPLSYEGLRFQFFKNLNYEYLVQALNQGVAAIGELYYSDYRKALNHPDVRFSEVKEYYNKNPQNRVRIAEVTIPFKQDLSSLKKFKKLMDEGVNEQNQFVAQEVKEIYRKDGADEALRELHDRLRADALNAVAQKIIEGKPSDSFSKVQIQSLDGDKQDLMSKAAEFGTAGISMVQQFVPDPISDKSHQANRQTAPKQPVLPISFSFVEGNRVRLIMLLDIQPLSLYNTQESIVRKLRMQRNLESRETFVKAFVKNQFRLLPDSPLSQVAPEENLLSYVTNSNVDSILMNTIGIMNHWTVQKALKNSSFASPFQGEEEYRKEIQENLLLEFHSLDDVYSNILTQKEADLFSKQRAQLEDMINEEFSDKNSEDLSKTLRTLSKLTWKVFWEPDYQDLPVSAREAFASWPEELGRFADWYSEHLLLKKS